MKNGEQAQAGDGGQETLRCGEHVRASSGHGGGSGRAAAGEGGLCRRDKIEKVFKLPDSMPPSNPDRITSP